MPAVVQSPRPPLVPDAMKLLRLALLLLVLPFAAAAQDITPRVTDGYADDDPAVPS